MAKRITARLITTNRPNMVEIVAIFPNGRRESVRSIYCSRIQGYQPSLWDGHDLATRLEDAADRIGADVERVNR